MIPLRNTSTRAAVIATSLIALFSCFSIAGICSAEAKSTGGSREAIAPARSVKGASPRVRWNIPRVFRVAPGSVLKREDCRLRVRANAPIRTVRLRVIGSKRGRGVSIKRITPKRKRTARRALVQCRLDTRAFPNRVIKVAATAVDRAGNRRTVIQRIVIEAPEPVATGPSVPPRWFAPDSVWNRSLADQQPLSSASSDYVSELNRMVDEFGPWINTHRYSVPIYTVDANHPTTSVEIRRDDGDEPDPALEEAFSSVPIPAEAKPSPGSDAHLVVWQPSTDRMWEFYGMSNEGGRWVAEHGGAMQDVSASDGIFGSSSWPGAKDWWGATATSLPLVGGLMTIEELLSGSINHALAMSVPEGSRHHVWPAKRSDGRSSSPTAIPEGTIFRLPADLDLDALSLPAPTLAIARAAQRHGMVVRDLAGCVCLYAEDPSQLATDPYETIFGGENPRRLLADFPWERLQVVAPSR